MLDLNDVWIFCRVADKGSLIAAARSLDLPSSTVSRRLAALELQAGVKLLHRSTRSLSLTEEGRRLHDAMSRPMRSIAEAQNVLQDGQGKPQGTLRVTAPPLFAGSLLSPLVSRFINAYPDIQVEIIASRSRLDLISEGLDLAIRAGQLTDSTLICRPLKPLPQVLVASADYLHRKGFPSNPTDLMEHDLIVFNAHACRQGVWHLNPKLNLMVNGRMGTSSYDQALLGALGGSGIALVPQFLAAEHIMVGRLLTLFEADVTTPLQLHLLYPERQLQPARVTAFIELLMMELGPS